MQDRCPAEGWCRLVRGFQVQAGRVGDFRELPILFWGLLIIIIV